MQPAQTRSCGSFFGMAFFICLLLQNNSFAQGANGSGGNSYGRATYTLTDAGKFMKHWLIAGPFTVAEESAKPSGDLQIAGFKDEPGSVLNFSNDPLPATKDPAKNWKLVSQADDIILFDSLFGPRDYVYAYALAEIQADKAAKVILAVGSDDAIRVWHNGKLVHDNWIPRSTEKDNDLVPLSLEKGSNQILIKVQDIEGGWSFAARMLDNNTLAEHMVKAATAGALDRVNFLMEYGASADAPDQTGVRPLEAARIAGRNQMVKLLLEKGAVERKVSTADQIVDRLYKKLNDGEWPAFAILVAKDGKVLYKKAFGYANIEKKEKAGPETKFRIGSVTKQFTAAAILKLSEKGLLKLDDKLSKFIPDFPRGDEVTIHHLLTHTSGIHSYTGKPEFMGRVVNTVTPDSLIAFFKNDPYDFNPGENYLYNNSAYFLLGYIISKLSGVSYDEYLRKTFFEPLKMTNTGVHHAGIKLSKEAKGYDRANGKVVEALNWDMSWAGGAGAMYSTLDDLMKWNEALHQGKVLLPDNYRAAITPVRLNNGEEPVDKYGYGLGIGKYRGIDRIGHSGGLHGFLSQLVYYPTEKLTVVMFTNTTSPTAPLNPDRIAEAFIWHKLDSQASYSEVKSRLANLEEYNGRYEFVQVGILTVKAEGEHLYAQLAGQPKFEIFPAGSDEFFWKVTEARLKFGRDQKGAITQATLFQNGSELVAKRLPDIKPINVDPSILDKYTGKYKLNEQITVDIITKDGKLVARATGQDELPMEAISETEFIIFDINARLTFVKGEDGKAAKIILNMNNSNTDMPRIE